MILRTSVFFMTILAGVPALTRAATLCVNPTGASGCVNSIAAALLLAAPNDTIQVPPGTYKENIVVTKPVVLMGANPLTTIIDSTGRANGIYIDGLDNPKLANVTVSGFSIKNANFEGVLITNASSVSILNNRVTGNNKSLDTSGSGSCPGQPAFETSESEDCGEGIHLIAVDHSTIANNYVENNAGGILLSDETGPTWENLITGNTVIDNPFDCGITLASHPPAAPLTASAGVYQNTISGNIASYNGVINGGGAGVGIFTPSPGTKNYGNVVIGNTLVGNGLPGVTLHSHAPNQQLSDNVIIGNHISNNGPDDSTSAPTGIAIIGLLAGPNTSLPIPGTIIYGNVITGEAIDIAIQSSTPEQVEMNDLGGGVIGIQNLGTAPINATLNFWGCSEGPGGGGNCATISGPAVLATPFTPRRIQE